MSATDTATDLVRRWAAGRAQRRIDGTLHPRFREDGMTARDLVRDVVGAHLSNTECDAILWELTPFPLAMGRDDLLPYLKQVRDGSRTFDSVYAEMDAAVAAAHGGPS